MGGKISKDDLLVGSINSLKNDSPLGENLKKSPPAVSKYS